jgi:hypothetical protein
MLAALVLAASVTGCPMCSGGPVEPVEEAPVRLVGATATGEFVTLTVRADGTVETGDPTPVAFPEEWSHRRLTNLSSNGHGLYGYESHTKRMMLLSHDGSTVLATRPVDVTGTVYRRGMCVTPTGAILLIDSGANCTIRVFDRDWHDANADDDGVPLVHLSGMRSIEAMTCAPDGTLYAVGNSPDTRGTVSRKLFTISLNSGEATLVGALRVHDLDALEWGDDGMLYATDTDDARAAHLFRIDPETAEVQDLGAVFDGTITAIGRLVDTNAVWRGCG